MSSEASLEQGIIACGFYLCTFEVCAVGQKRGTLYIFSVRSVCLQRNDIE